MGTPLIEQLAAAPAVGQDYRPYALSAAGDAVAFEWYRDGDWQIFIQSLPDGDPVRVGNLADRCGCPQFSPDGRSLYFTCDDRGSECYDIYRYDVDAGTVVNLLPDTPDLAPLPDPDLSPDGSQLAMTVSHGAGYAVAVMPAQPRPRRQPRSGTSPSTRTPSARRAGRRTARSSPSRPAPAARTRPSPSSTSDPASRAGSAAPTSSSPASSPGRRTAAASPSPAARATIRRSASTSSPPAPSPGRGKTTTSTPTAPRGRRTAPRSRSSSTWRARPASATSTCATGP